MKRETKIRRNSSFWQGAFLAAYAELLRRAPPSDKVLPGARIASLACNMADDCDRARWDEGGTCEECKGVGCEACRFTGKAGASEGLHPPSVARSLTLVTPPPPEEGQAAPSSLDALSRSIAAADRDTQVKRVERFSGGKVTGSDIGGGGGGADPES